MMIESYLDVVRSSSNVGNLQKIALDQSVFGETGRVEWCNFYEKRVLSRQLRRHGPVSSGHGPVPSKVLIFFCARVIFSPKTWLEDLPVSMYTYSFVTYKVWRGCFLFVDRLKQDLFLLILNGSSIEFKPLAIDFEWNSISSFTFYCTVRKKYG
ncbi:hypothetical protein HanIR_Chr09g0405451 [Helianthus annuus]|nr:hypothetical protein HanIR_Chr09g0405451 [Helianthus annuus]